MIGSLLPKTRPEGSLEGGRQDLFRVPEGRSRPRVPRLFLSLGLVPSALANPEDESAKTASVKSNAATEAMVDPLLFKIYRGGESGAHRHGGRRRSLLAVLPFSVLAAYVQSYVARAGGILRTGLRVGWEAVGSRFVQVTHNGSWR